MSVMESVPLRVPVAVGEKVTLMVQLAVGARVEEPDGQVLVWAKSPPAEMPFRVRGAVPLLVSVTDFAALVVATVWLLKLRLVVLKLTAGAVPVPLSVTVWGLPDALSVIERVPPRLPVAVGVKVTLMMQLAPALSFAGLMGQVLVWTKSPFATILVMLKAPLPAFVRETALAELVVPTSWLPKLRLVASSCTSGAGEMPVPCSDTVCGLPGALSVTVRVPV